MHRDVPAPHIRPPREPDNDAHALEPRHSPIARRKRYAAPPTTPEAAAVVNAPIPPRRLVNDSDLAAWTMLAGAALDLYETTTQE